LCARPLPAVDISIHRTLRTSMNVGRFAAGLIVIVLGALMIAEGVLGWVTGTSLFYEGVNHSFEFVVGFIAIVLGASLLDEGKKK